MHSAVREQRCEDDEDDIFSLEMTCLLDPSLRGVINGLVTVPKAAELIVTRLARRLNCQEVAIRAVCQEVAIRASGQSHGTGGFLL